MEYVSAGCLELTGYVPQALVDSQSLSYNSLIHPEDRGRVWRLHSGGRAQCAAVRLRLSPAVRRWQ